MKLCKILFLFLSTPISLNAMVSYQRLKAPDDKEVLIIGDVHKFNDPIISKFFALFMAKIIGFNLSRPVPFIVEYENEGGEASIESTFSLILKLDANQKAVGAQEFEFDSFDPRGRESQVLDGLSSGLSGVITEGVSPAYLAKHYNVDIESTYEEAPYDESLWQATAEKIKANNLVIDMPPTVEEFLIYLDANYQRLEALLSKYPENPQMLAILKEAYKRYKEASEKIKTLFKPEDNFGSAYARSFLVCENLDERIALFGAYNKLFGTETDYLFAECLFLDRILETLSSRPCVCIVVGNAHSEPLAKNLIALGYTLLKKDSQVSFAYPLLHSFNIRGKFATTLAKEELPSFLECLSKTCWSCSTRPEKLLVCSRCKKAQYCNAECQKKDWKKHKKNCSNK